MRVCVVTFADSHSQRYEQGVIRMKYAVKDWMSSADFICFSTFEEIGSPTHKEVPYAFKPYAIAKARAMGYDLVLWCDSVVYPIQDLKPIFEHIKNNGYVFFDNIGYTIASYTNDSCLEIMNMSRDEASETQMIMACCMGFDFRNEKVNEVFDSYLFNATSGAYDGSWSDHRHDQSVMSILIKQNNLEVLTGHETFFAYAKGSLPIGNSVSLLSE